MRDVICCADWAQLLYLVLTSPALQSCAWTTALLALPLWDDFVWSKQGRFGCMQRPQPSSFPGTRRHAAERTCKHQQAVLWTGLRAENNLTIYVCYGSAVSRGDDFSSALFDRLCIKSWVYLRRVRRGNGETSRSARNASRMMEKKSVHTTEIRDPKSCS